MHLEQYITLDEEAIKATNLCDRFTERDLQTIGEEVWSGYARDCYSQSKWERRVQAAMDLALQVQKDKNFPWPGASNVAFPLITIAALQFHSRAYPTIVSGREVVKCQVVGQDPTGEKTQRADRISVHMSYQLLEEDKAWEESVDRLLINLPIVGNCFIKTYWNAEKNGKTEELVLAQDLVLDYWAKSVEDCPRKTQRISMFRNGVHSRIKRKVFRDVSEEAWYNQPPSPQTGTTQIKVDNRLGLSIPATDMTTPFLLLEQHVDMDLDGDGYAEPYIITIEDTSKCVLRIVAGCDQESDIERTSSGEVISIRRLEYFTKFDFIPSPDGGVRGMGFGVLIGPLNESTNTLINQLIDAGTMSTAAGGFLGRGAKIRGGVYTFAPLEWKRVDSTGEDLQKSIYPLPVRDPSPVLFNLLSLLINYVNRIAGTTDPMVGENPGQNTPAENMRTMVQEGMKIYSAIFKRVWRSMKEEFRKGYILNGIYMPRMRSFGKGQMILREDYLGNPDEVVPVADPNIVSEQMQMQQLQLLKSSAATTPGYDHDAVERRFLKAIKVDNIDEVFPGVKKTGAPEDVKITIQKLKLQGEQAKLQAAQQEFILNLSEEQRMNNAEIGKIMAEIETMKQTVQGDNADRQINMLNSIIGMLKLRNEHITGQMDIVKKALEVKRAQIDADARDDGGLEGTSDNRGADKGSSGKEKAAA